MDEKEGLHRFGTPLEPLAKDEVSTKKPITVEEQIVKDENGKRRFHGAFTGGFSAGFWNTVGSLHGWTPQSFKSSREERAEQRTQQRPEDFMDEEDLGEFGIAPQGIRTREEFSKDENSGSRKRKFMQSTVGTIPGLPVLEQLLQPVGDRVAVRILKSMGWKPGQGVGPRQTRKEKKQSKARIEREEYLKQHYGCTEEDGLRPSAKDVDSDESDDDAYEEITFAPDDYEQSLCTVKDNRFGLSYTGLSRNPSTSKHVDDFIPLEVMDKDKKLSIRGQAFGVGAFEKEDEDIYAREDLSRYDFSLAGDGKPKEKKVKHVQERNVIEGFSEEKDSTIITKPFTIDLPRDFKPRNWAVRKSRFEPMDPTRLRQLEAENDYKKAGLGRHDLDPNQRAQLLGEKVPKDDDKKAAEKDAENELTKEKEVEGVEPEKEIQKTNAISDRAKKLLEQISVKSSNFTSGGVITEKGEEKMIKKEETVNETEDTVAKTEEEPNVTKEVPSENAKLTEETAAKTKRLKKIRKEDFKPFRYDPDKQRRYEEFLESKLELHCEIYQFLVERQPPDLSLWGRERELNEFIQARDIYKPIDSIMSDRFVPAATMKKLKMEEPEPEVKRPARDKSRTIFVWRPDPRLCKRYNVEPPHVTQPGLSKPSQPKSKISVFSYMESSLNSKENFKTPVIVPDGEKAAAAAAATSSKEVDSNKRYNVEPPYVTQPGSSKPLQPKSKISVFSFMESSLNSKENFKTPVIVPDGEKAAAATSSKEVDSNKREDLAVVDTAAAATSSKAVDSNKRKELTAPVGAPKIKRKFVPKTELEKLNEANLDKPASEKNELFRKVFDSIYAFDLSKVNLAPEQKRLVTRDDHLRDFCEDFKVPLPRFLRKIVIDENGSVHDSPPHGAPEILYRPLPILIPAGAVLPEIPKKPEEVKKPEISGEQTKLNKSEEVKKLEKSEEQTKLKKPEQVKKPKKSEKRKELKRLKKHKKSEKKKNPTEPKFPFKKPSERYKANPVANTNHSPPASNGFHGNSRNHSPPATNGFNGNTRNISPPATNGFHRNNRNHSPPTTNGFHGNNRNHSPPATNGFYGNNKPVMPNGIKEVDVVKKLKQIRRLHATNGDVRQTETEEEWVERQVTEEETSDSERDSSLSSSSDYDSEVEYRKRKKLSKKSKKKKSSSEKEKKQKKKKSKKKSKKRHAKEKSHKSHKKRKRE